MRGVAVVESIGPLAINLAHDDEVATALVTEFQRILDLGDQDDALRAPVEGYGRGGEGAEDVDDDGGPLSFLGALDEAAPAVSPLLSPDLPLPLPSRGQQAGSCYYIF